ncbi:DUF3332 family protein [Elusimicrobiota bacterium]
MKKIIQLCVMLTVVIGLAGCYGGFNLTKKLYNWNGEMGEKWVDEAVFLGLLIIPAYSVATMVDGLILNSIEFWSGNNPVQVKGIKSIEKGKDQAVMTYLPDSKRLRVDNFRAGKHIFTYILKPGTDGNMIATDENDKVLMSATTTDGMIVVTSTTGKEVGRYHPSQLEHILAKRQ